MFIKIKNTSGVEIRVSVNNISHYYEEELLDATLLNIVLLNKTIIKTAEHAAKELDQALSGCYVFIKEVPKL